MNIYEAVVRELDTTDERAPRLADEWASILDLLSDGEPHTVNECKAASNLSHEGVRALLRFAREAGVVELVTEQVPIEDASGKPTKRTRSITVGYRATATD